MGLPYSFATTTADFHPRRFLANGHVQTILGNFLPRTKHLPPPESVLVEVAPAAPPTHRAAQVLCLCHWQPQRSQAITAILLHGLEGSSSSQYVLGNTEKLLHAGCNIIRMNMRNCGGTEHLTPSLYHSGLSGDVLAVLSFFIARDHLERVALVGYSMGGNLVLKLAGELGPSPPPQLCAVVGVSPVVDLAESADALHEPLNRLYEARFLHSLLARFRRKVALFPALYDITRASGIHSLRAYDDRITAPYAGFQNSSDYYSRASSARTVRHIQVPTLILHALDDPFIRLTAETHAAILANPSITLLEPPHGGHCAFLAKPDPASGNDGYWAEHTALSFLEHTAPRPRTSPAPHPKAGSHLVAAAQTVP